MRFAFILSRKQASGGRSGNYCGVVNAWADFLPFYKPFKNNVFFRQCGNDRAVWADPATGPHRPGLENPHILNTPNFVSGIGALSVAENASASTRRVSVGAMTPSSHSRAVA